MENQNEIWFYDTKDKPYGVFSNFYPCKLKYNDIIYNNSEGYYQAEKFKGPDSTKKELEYSVIIQTQNTGNKSAQLARQTIPRQPYKWAQELKLLIQESIKNNVKMRKDWEAIKDNVMRRAVYLKFSQNSKLKDVLIGTDDKLLFEHTFRDLYWADGHPKNNPNVHGEGKNMLGIILEEGRYILGGKLSSRFTSMLTFEYSHWIIPGMFLVSGAPDKNHFNKMKDNGFKYFVSLMEYQEELDRLTNPYHNILTTEDSCMVVESDIIVSRFSITDRNITSDEKAVAIALTILTAISYGLPAVLHCYGGKGRTGTIAAIVVGFLYGISGIEALEIVGRLYKEYRPNKVPKSPQTKSQFDQVKRVLAMNDTYTHFIP